MILCGTQIIEDRPYKVYVCKGMHQINKITMSEDKFEWTDEKVKEFYEWYSSIYANPTPTGYCLEEFKKTKQNSFTIKADKDNSGVSGQKDWEIVAYKNKHSGEIDDFGGHTWRRESIDHHPIHSVKRLSDNEVFSVGDKVSYGKPCEIIRLFISSNNLMWCDLKYENGNEYHNANIGALDKAKQPLFSKDDIIDLIKKYL